MAKANQDPETQSLIEAWQDARHSTIQVDDRLVSEGDTITANMPSGGNRVHKKVTFIAYVTPEDKAPYVEVADKYNLSRCIRVEDIVKGGSKI